MSERQRLTIEDIKSAANAHMGEVLAACGINERVSASGYISMCNPVRKDRHPSFTIWTKNGFIAWTDHATGEKGDVLDLVAYTQGWWDRPKRGCAEACRFLTGVLHLDMVSSYELDRDRAVSRTRALQHKKAGAEEQARNEGKAMELWLKAVPIAGTVAEIYLREARGIDLNEFPRGPRGGLRSPSILRFLPNHEHRESGQHLPCLIAGCVDYALDEARIRAVHRTWLKPDGSGKADVTPPRKVWPGFTGLVIPIWKGADNLSIREAIDHGVRETLVLTEGIEDGLTAALADPGQRVWAMISLGNMGNVPVPQCIDGIIVHRQNDWNKRQAVEAFERGKTALERSGRTVVEVEALGGKDLNDTLRGE